MNVGLVLLVVGGFLLGGAWSVWRSDEPAKERSGPQVAFAVILLLSALLATAAGVLRLVRFAPQLAPAARAARVRHGGVAFDIGEDLGQL